VASELLATSATLGGLPVTDNTLEAHETIVDALVAAGDWRYTPEWLLETWNPGDGTASLAISRAAIAGWADETRSGIVMYVYGGALHDVEGLVGTPGPLHSYTLAVTRSTDGTDAAVAAHRVIWSSSARACSTRRRASASSSTGAAAPPALPRVAVSALGSVAGKVVVLSIWCLLYLRICTECDRGVTPFFFLQARRHRCWSGWAPRSELA